MTFTITQVCNYFGYSRQAFYKQRRQQASHLAVEQQVIAAVVEIRKRQPMIGARKIHHLLRQQRGFGIGRDRLFALLRQHQLLIAPTKRYVKTTNSWHRFRKYSNLIKQLDIIKPDQVYVADITYVTLTDGFCYLFLITDLFSRKIVGYCLSHSLGIDGCLTALTMALKGVERPLKLIHHSDRGIQYCSQAYVALLERNGIQISMTEENHVYENAVAERVNGILKTEFRLGETLPSFKIVQQLVAEAIRIYNEQRPHLSLNYQAPNEVYYANKYHPIKGLSATATENNQLNLADRSTVGNSGAINIQSTSYPRQNKGFQHISEYLKLIKLNSYNNLSP